MSEVGPDTLCAVCGKPFRECEFWGGGSAQAEARRLRAQLADLVKAARRDIDWEHCGNEFPHLRAVLDEIEGEP